MSRRERIERTMLEYLIATRTPYTSHGAVSGFDLDRAHEFALSVLDFVDEKYPVTFDIDIDLRINPPTEETAERVAEALSKGLSGGVKHPACSSDGEGA